MSSTATKRENINELLTQLSEDALAEIRDFTAYLLDRERRRKALEERVLEAEKELPIKFETVDDAVKAVFDETED
ncbi:MAG: hypothetical protein HY758_10520 [Nitrospirae bacterium]|nr:hypothetical protein [Nitrospirota bacterium]